MHYLYIKHYTRVTIWSSEKQDKNTWTNNFDTRRYVQKSLLNFVYEWEVYRVPFCYLIISTTQTKKRPNFYNLKAYLRRYYWF